MAPFNPVDSGHADLLTADKRLRRRIVRGLESFVENLKGCKKRPIANAKNMSRSVVVELDMPGDLKQFRLPKGVNRRLQQLLDKQSREGKLSRAERQEAEGLVD